MSAGAQDRGDVADRARAWRHAAHSAVCDVVEPWAHGTVVRATRYPSYFDLNVVRVESEPGMSVDELAGFADKALAGLAHRRIDFDVVAAADARRPEFEARGWTAMRLLWMHHGGGPVPGGSEMAVEAVPYDAVHELRVRWMLEDGMPEPDAAGYHAQAREVALAQGAEVLAVREAGELVAFAQLIRSGGAAEIHQVFVLPAFRGRGRGTALTRAAIAAAGEVDDLWICADDEQRAKDLYARLGFLPARRAMELTRLL
jgi:ribosomal protein S18 acetylase RimI-like enzyme